jgi:CRP/FNR family transcriptional regulator, cyclic AMP receptor protein
VWCDAGVRSLLSDDLWKQLTSLGRKRTYDTGARLIGEGDDDTYVIVLVDGRVKVTCSEQDGTEVLLSIRGDGDIVGERAAIDQDVRSASVTALRPCTTRVLSAEEFFAFVDAHALARPLLRLAVARQREGQRIRVELTTLAVSQRLVRTLLRLGDAMGGAAAGTGAGKEPVAVDLGLSQEELARAIGASRSQVAACLRWLRREGVVSTGRRRIVILDRDRLRGLDAGQR